MKKIFYIVTLLTLCFTSCRVSLVPAKSPATVVTIIDIGNNVEDLYDDIITGTDKSYSLYDNQYQAIAVKIDSVLARDQRREHAGNIVAQDKIIKRYFARYREDHKSKNVLNNGELKVYKSYMRSFLKPRLVSETSLK